MSELLHCPFCGGPGRHWSRETVTCSTETCPLRGYGIPVGRWNTRPLDAAAAANAERGAIDWKLVDAAMATRFECERLAEENAEMRKACQLVMEWWKEHEFDAIPLGDGDERNAYDEEHEMVKQARAALAPKETR